jgi:hypothetical protein
MLEIHVQAWDRVLSAGWDKTTKDYRISIWIILVIIRLSVEDNKPWHMTLEIQDKHEGLGCLTQLSTIFQLYRYHHLSCEFESLFMARYARYNIMW